MPTIKRTKRLFELVCKKLSSGGRGRCNATVVNVIPLLNKIGLTEAESKAYLSLLRYGSSSGYEVSKISGVPRSKIYNILETLVTKGFVRFTEGEGTNQYLAVPIEEVSERIQKETKDTLEELTIQLKEYQTSTDLEYIWHIREYKNVFAKCRNIIQHTEEELLIQIWEEDFPQVENELQELENKGVRLGIVYFSEDENSTIPFKHYSRHGMLSEKRKEMGGRFITLVSDEKEAIFGQIVNETVAEVIWTKSKPMIAMSAECVRHDMYFYKNAGKFKEEMQEEFGKDYIKIRDIF